MKFLKPVLLVFGMLVYMGGAAQLTSQKKYGEGGTTSGNLITLDLKGNGILVISPGGRILRLNNNFDTVWVKVMPEFFYY